MRAALLALAAAACLGASAPPEPRARALLIGVGDYDGLPEFLQLRAPDGDVRRLEAALTGAGLPKASIEVMTERRGARPTRAAILAALDQLARDAQPGDQVMVYFSGHGAQAPARYPDREPDGLEEVFLAADATAWDDRAETLPGSLADFEIETALNAIRARGAHVWFVVDACHAAGAMRSGLAEDARVKSAGMAELGLPMLGRPLRSTVRDSAPLAPSSGGGAFTAFYAAAPGALAVERRLPPGAEHAAPASVFTFALTRALAQGRHRSFRDLAAAISGAAAETGVAPQPVFEGALAGAPMGLAPADRRFPVQRRGAVLIVQAGAGEGFDADRAVELFVEGRPVGTAIIERAGLATAILRFDRPPPPGRLEARLMSTAAPEARGARLLRALAPLTGQAAAEHLFVEAGLWRQGCGPNPPARDGVPPGASPLSLSAPPLLRHCDVLYGRIENAGPYAIDVSPLYVDAAGAIAALGLAPADSVRMEPGETRYFAVRLLTQGEKGERLPSGTERLVLVAVRAGRDAPRDLRSLADPAAWRDGSAVTIDEQAGALIYPLQLQD